MDGEKFYVGVSRVPYFIYERFHRPAERAKTTSQKLVPLPVDAGFERIMDEIRQRRDEAEERERRRKNDN